MFCRTDLCVPISTPIQAKLYLNWAIIPVSDRPKQYPWLSWENSQSPVRFSSWRINLFPCLQLSRSGPLKDILWWFSHLLHYKTLFIYVNLTLFPAPTRIMFNKNRLVALATGAESGKDSFAYLQNSPFIPTHHSQDKDIKIYKKYWYANEMGLTIFCIHASIYRPVKVGFRKQMNHLPLFLKFA